MRYGYEPVGTGICKTCGGEFNVFEKNSPRMFCPSCNYQRKLEMRKKNAKRYYHYVPKSKHGDT